MMDCPDIIAGPGCGECSWGTRGYTDRTGLVHIFHDGEIVADHTIGADPFGREAIVFHFKIKGTTIGYIGIIHGIVWIAGGGST